MEQWDPIGQKLGPYRILAPLGEGGMGLVFRAEDARLPRDVAIKLLPPSLVSDPERVARFLREAHAAAAISHPSIATVLDFGTTDGRAWIAMELVNGVTLRELASRGPVGTHEALRIVTQIARGVAHAHDRGIVHRDLKPENVMITPEGDVKVLDFGLAKATAVDAGQLAHAATDPAWKTQPGVFLGTPGYMPLEQAQDASVGPPADVYALGVILYELLANRRLWTGATPLAVLARQLTEAPPPIDSVPPPLAAILARALAREPADRYRDARAFLDALSPTESGPPQNASGATGIAATVPPPPRGRRRWWIAGLLLAAALASVALYSAYPSPEPPGRREPLVEPGEHPIEWVREAFIDLPDEAGLTAFAIDPSTGNLAFATRASVMVEGPGLPRRALAPSEGRWVTRLSFVSSSDLWVSSCAGERCDVDELHLDGRPPTRVLEDASRASRSPDGRWTAYLVPHPEALVLTDGAVRRRVPLVGTLEYAWLPDSSGVVVTHLGESEARPVLATFGVDGRWTELASEPGLVLAGGGGGLGFDASGRLVYAVQRGRPPRERLMRARLEGGRLVGEEDLGVEPSRPLSDLVFLEDGSLAGLELHTRVDVDVADTQALGSFARWTPSEPQDRAVGFSRDGSLVLVSDRDGRWMGYVQASAHAEARRFLSFEDADAVPGAITPDGSEALVWRVPVPRDDERVRPLLFAVALDGSRPPRRVLDPGIDVASAGGGAPPPRDLSIACSVGEDGTCAWLAAVDGESIIRSLPLDGSAGPEDPRARIVPDSMRIGSTGEELLLSREDGLVLLQPSGSWRFERVVAGCQAQHVLGIAPESALVTLTCDAPPIYRMARWSRGVVDSIATDDFTWFGEMAISRDQTQLAVTRRELIVGGVRYRPR